MILDKLKALFTRPSEVEQPESEDRKLFNRLVKDGCVVCDDNPDFQVIEGPSGGMSQNVWCYKCGTRYNITIFGPGPYGIAELLTERERDFTND